MDCEWVNTHLIHSSQHKPAHKTSYCSHDLSPPPLLINPTEDGSEIKTTRVVTTKMTTKETTLNGEEAEVEEADEDDERPASPQDAGLRSASSAEASPTKDATSPSKKKDKDKDKKKKFRTPSFLKIRKDKEKKADS